MGFNWISNDVPKKYKAEFFRGAQVIVSYKCFSSPFLREFHRAL